MYTFIQRNKKKLLAVFGVMLMVVFVLPFGVGNFGQPDPTTLAYGKVGDETITRGDVGRAGQDLDALSRAGFLPLMQLGEPPQPIFQPPQGRAAAMLRETPATYALLQREARAAGVAPSEDEVAALYTQYFARVPNKTADEADAYRSAVRGFLLVRDNFRRVTADLKVTAPMVRTAIATQQQATLNLVEFAADDFLPQAAEPTPEQVRAHYDRYAAVAPATPSMGMPATQPVQFGYKRPDRVKLQYLELPRDRVVEAAVKGLGEDELLPLDRVAYVHYDANPQDFQGPPAAAEAAAPPTTNPTSGPTSGPAASPTTGPASSPATTPAAQPTTRPFKDAVAEVRRNLLTGKTPPPAAAFPEDLNALRAAQSKLNARTDELQGKLRDRLLTDFQAFRGGTAGGTPQVAAGGPSTQPSGPTTNPSTVPATAPASSPATAPTAVAVDKLEYLEAVADEFEKAHGVRPMVTSLANEWLTRDGLNRLTGIGTSFSIQGPFPELATKHSEVEAQGPMAPTTPATPAGPTTSPTTAPTTNSAEANPPATAPSTSPSTAPAGEPSTAPAAVPATPPGLQPTPPAKPAMALFEPSPLLRDPAENVYVFRLTAFEGEHVAPLEQVREQMVQNLKLSAAYDDARQQAEAVRAAAGSSANHPTGGLPTSAETAKRKLIVAGPINPRMMEVPGYDLAGDPAAQQTFLMSIAGLSARATPDQPHPSTVVELPAQRKALAVELRALERSWPAAEDPAMQARSLDMARTQLFRDRAIDMALLNWFDADTVAKRTQFTKSERG